MLVDLVTTQDAGSKLCALLLSSLSFVLLEHRAGDRRR